MKKLLISILLLTISGCGGGTSGTGGTGNGSSEIVGKVADTRGNPIAKAQIIIEETGDNTISNENGEFDFESSIATDKVTVLVTSENTEARAIVDQIPEGPQIINLSLEIDKRQRTVKVKKKDIKPRPRKPRPTPTAAPEATATPIIEPTIVPTIEVTVTPITDPTPTAELFTQFVGKIVSSDPLLISDAKVAVVGKGRRVVQPDGTFRFRIKAAADNNHLLVASNNKVARIKIDAINEKTKRVRLQLRLERKPDSSLTLMLESAEIMEH